MTHRTGAAAALIAAIVACRGQPQPKPASLEEDPIPFERLRDMILEEPICYEVDDDHYAWTDPYTGGPSASAASTPKTGRPPGVSAAPCGYVGGCTRWVAERPSPEILASICKMALDRAREYQRTMRHAGVLSVHRPAPDHFDPEDTAVFLMDRQGIITSGSMREIVWRAVPPSVMQSGTGHMGHEYRKLARPGWYEKISWN